LTQRSRILRQRSPPGQAVEIFPAPNFRCTQAKVDNAFDVLRCPGKGRIDRKDEYLINNLFLLTKKLQEL